jgi:hypothetical protein
MKSRQGDKPNQALAFPLITDLVKNDAEMSSLLEAYRPYILMDVLKQETNSFLEHAHTYIIRVQALPKIIETGAPLPSWKPFPQGFPLALQHEIAKRRGQLPRGVEITEKSGFRLGGYSQKQCCEEATLAKKVQYPNTMLTVVSSSEEGSKSNIRTEYQYSCTIRVRDRR